MTVTNPNTYRTLRPLLVSFFVHIILWYSLYVVALLQTAPPLWALNFIEQLKPTLGALDTAARLSQHPFSAQVMILYAILSSFLLGMYWVYYIFGVQHFAQETYRGLCERWGHTGLPVKVRLKLAACGVAALYAYGYEIPIRYYVKGGYLNNWLSSALFSSSILSSTFLLSVSITSGMAFVVGPLFIYMSIVRFQSPHQ